MGYVRKDFLDNNWRSSGDNGRYALGKYQFRMVERNIMKKEIRDEDLEKLNRAMFEIFGKDSPESTSIYTKDK